MALKLEGLANNYEDQWFRMVQKQEDQWTSMAKQMDTTFREVLSQMSQVNLVRLLPWFLSATAKSSAGSTCSVSEALTSVTTSELEGTTAPVLMSSPAHRVSTLPPVPPALDIPVASTPALQLGNCSSYSALVWSIRIGPAPLAAHLKVKVARGPALALRKAVSAVGAVLHLFSWYPATAPNKSLSSSISLQVRSRWQLTPMTGWLQRPGWAP